MKESEAIIRKELVLDGKEFNIGIITDIHGNDEAFKVALKQFRNCDFIINLGDLPGIGPNSNEVLDIAKELIHNKKLYTVLGNHERYLLFGFFNPNSCLTHEQQAYTEQSISQENLKMIEDFPLELFIQWNNQTLVFLHYARRIYDGVRFKLIEHNPSLDTLIQLFEYHHENYVFYGHEHQGCILENENRHFINPGSTGCPCPKKNTLRYGILHLNDSIQYEQFELEYDASGVVKSMIDKKMPNRELIIHDFYKEEL